MIQIKFKQLATVGVCCSMLANSLTGVTAVAETMTIESSPTSESSTKKETTENSTKVSETATETSEKKEIQETERPTVKQSEAEEKLAIELEGETEDLTTEVVEQPAVQLPSAIQNRAIGVKAGNVWELDTQFQTWNQSYPANGNRFNVPELHFGISIVSQNEIPLNMADFSLSSNMTLGKLIYPIGATVMPTPSKVTIQAPNTVTTTGFDITIPEQSLTLANIYRAESSFYYLNDPILKVPKYIDTVIAGEEGTYKRMKGTIDEAPYTLTLEKTGEGYVLQQPKDRWWSYDLPGGFAADLLSANGPRQSSIYFYIAQQAMNLIVTHKKVTESFKNTAGATIPAPNGFEEGRKTSITNNNFTFKQSGTLPETYTAGGKTYKFKGWYKGKNKPATLETTKTPSYAVTYDDNDDLNVVYEEVVPKTVTVPAVDYLFGFINEKGAYDYDAKLTATITEVSGGTVKNGSAITSVPEGIFQKLTIPSKTLTYTETSPAYYGVTKANVQVPKYYKQPTVKPGSYFTGPVGGYPMATIALQNIANGQKSNASVDGSRFDVVPNESAKPNNYLLVSNSWTNDTTKTAFSTALSMTTTVNAPSFFTTEDKMFYFLENRRVTENFVDSNGTKITPPTDFTQGKKTVIDSESYTFKQSGTLPDSYTADGKTYKFKGWYKGTDATKMETTKTPSYAVTYDDQDDLTVVYEEADKVVLPGYTYQFGFVDEAGKIVDPTQVNMTYDMWTYEDKVETIEEKALQGKNAGNLKELSIADRTVLTPTAETAGEDTIYSPINLQFSLPKYYQTMTPSDGSNTSYPVPQMIQNSSGREQTLPVTNDTFALKETAPYTFGMKSLYINPLVPDTPYPIPFRRYTKWAGGPVPVNTTYVKVASPIYYMLKNRRVTEHFVNTAGAKITAPTGFTQGNQIPMTSETFKYTAAQALPATYTADGKTYTFQGWYKGKSKPTALEKTTTPTFAATFDDNDDMTAVYKEETPTADVSMKGAVTVIPSGGNQLWYVTIANTGKAPLSNVKLKPTANFATGLARPIQASIKIGTTSKIEPITEANWTNGVAIPDIPVGQSAQVILGTVATGQPEELLQAEVLVSGNFTSQTTSATVRIQGTDQTITEPTGEGFISVPTFDFGQVGISGSRQQHGLKKAANYYGNGTRNPFVRIKKTQPNWSLTAQLSQPKSAKDSLPTATRLLLGQAPVASFSNYNLPTELKNPVGTTSAISLNANDTATSIIANQQFTGSDIYQLDFVFNNVKLEVPANQGLKGQQYTANVTWNLVTGP